MKANFFERRELGGTVTSIWEELEVYIESPELCNGVLLKFSKRHEGRLIPCYFSLQSSHLLFKRTEKHKKFKAALTLRHSYICFPDLQDIREEVGKCQEGLFPIKVYSGRKYTLLFADSESSFKIWMSAFNKKSIRTSFHEDFKVEHCIGSGTFAYVYEASRVSSGQRLAVKGFNKRCLLKTKEKNALINEIKILRSLNNKNVVRLEEVHETQNSIYLVMEHMAGTSLATFIHSKRGKVPEHDIFQVMKGLLKGVAYLQQRGCIHRDLKPSNIMLRKTHDLTCDDVVIVDFGLATYLDDMPPVYRHCGTPGYIAPEIFTHNFDSDLNWGLHNCDLFSAGCVLHALLTGHSPFKASTLILGDSELENNRNNKIAISSQISSISNALLVQVMNGLLQKDPLARLPAARALELPLLTSATVACSAQPEEEQAYPVELLLKPCGGLQPAQPSTADSRREPSVDLHSRKIDHERRAPWLASLQAAEDSLLCSPGRPLVKAPPS